MSYILDALKKSDRERQQGKIPGLNSIHDPYPVPPENRSTGQQIKYISITIGLILLISTPAITWYRAKIFTNSDTPVIIEKTREIVTEPEKNIPPTASIKSPADGGSTYLPPPPTITTQSTKMVLLPDQTGPLEEKETAISVPAQEPADIPEIISVPSQVVPDIPRIENLPPSIREDIPDLNLAGHTYSDSPEKRMIIINSNILREGDRLDNNLKLVEITWTGVILDHNGKQFSVDIE